MLVAPGPGMFTAELTTPFDVAGTQNTVPRLPRLVAPPDRSPGFWPPSLMHRVAGFPNAPAFDCPWPFTGGLGGQKIPVDDVWITSGVERSGFSETAGAP